MTDHDKMTVGAPALDRQERPIRRDVHGRPLVPSRVPETRPTPLQDWFIYLSIGVLVCGVIAIMALELGSPMSAPVVRIPVVVGGVLLLAVTADAALRIWRSVWAWMPVDRGLALFRLLWTAVLVGALVVTVGGIAVVVAA